jgi:hypothetical protein
MKKRNDKETANKFGYSDGDIKVIKIKKPQKPIKESYSSFAEFLFEKNEEKFVASTMRWITIKDENDRNQHILIKKKDGTILAGMGGEHNGEKLKDAFKNIEAEKKENDAERKENDRKASELVSKWKDADKYADMDWEEYKEKVLAPINDKIYKFEKSAIKEDDIHSMMSIKDELVKDSEEDKAIQKYTTWGFYLMNDRLRYPEKYKKDNSAEAKETEESIETLSKYIRSHKTPEDIIVYRGIKKGLAEKLKYEYMLQTNDILADDGFVSTSSDRSVANSFTSYDENGIILKILVPKGSHAISVRDVSPYGAQENEVILDKGAKFKVLKALKNEFTVELIQD